MGGDLTFDVTDADFDELVLKASPEQVIVVDFWAPWCESSGQLTPVLEKVLSSADATVMLAMANVDENPSLANRFHVVGIPTVKVFHGGEIVAEFVGAHQEEEVRALLACWLPSKIERFVADGDALREAGGLKMADELYGKALKLDPNHAGANLGAAQVSLQKGELDRAEALLGPVGEESEAYDRAQGLLGQVGLARHCQEKGGAKACAERLAGDPNNLDFRYDHACCLAAAGRHQEALDEMLLILAENKDYQPGAAKDAVVRIFTLLGAKNPVADEYRRRLATVLY